MPELPEVETIILDLKPEIEKKKILNIDVFNQGSINQPAEIFKKNLINKKIVAVSRRGKNIIFKLSQDYLVIHLKMTGQLVWRDKKGTKAGGHPIINVGQELPNKFTRVDIIFSNGTLYFNDVRKFGWLRLLTKDQLDLYLLKLGAEPLGSDFSWEYFKNLYNGKRITIKQALLDQTKIAGLGNIYVDEALWAAGIAPLKSAGNLSAVELKKLHKAIKDVLILSIKQRGTSFSDYRDGHGQKGNNMKFLKVYGRAGESCPKCKKLINKIKIGGRGTHWCDHCQK